MKRQAHPALPFSFNEGAQFVIAINESVVDPSKFLQEIAHRLSTGSDRVIFESFASPGATAIEIGLRVPDRVAHALLATLEVSGVLRDSDQVYRMPDEEKFGYVQRMYVGSRKPDGLRMSSQELERLLRHGRGSTPSPAPAAKVAADRHFLRGRERIHHGRESEAEDEYRQGLQLDPTNAGAWMDLGVLLKELGELEESEEALRKSLALRPDSGDSWFNLGSLYLRNLERTEEAVACLYAAIRSNADDETAVDFAAEALFKVSRIGAAASVLRRFVECHPHATETQAMLQRLGRMQQVW